MEYAIEGCDRSARARQMCTPHYKKLMKYGDPLAGTTYVRGDDHRRFWSKIDKNAPDGCWRWLGYVTPRGYGMVWMDGHMVAAHRFAYKALVGPITDGMTLDHTCHTAARAECHAADSCLHRRCVNPAHLEPVTVRENNLRGTSWGARNATKTHCLRGHEYTEANTVREPDGRRRCRTCLVATGRRANRE